MPLDNNLNVSELFKRLGIKGDSLGSAPLLESIRLSLLIGDLSNLVPPVGTPFGGAAIFTSSGVGTFNKFSLACLSPGGLRVMTLEATTGEFDLFVTDTNVFGAVVNSAAHNFAFDQPVLSLFRNHTIAAKVAPAFTFEFGGAFPSSLVDTFETWVGPGQFFNMEATGANSSQNVRISWKEYPGALSP